MSAATILSSAARTESVASEGTDFPSYARELLIYIDVTAASGTNPTLDIAWQVSPDGGTAWFDHTAATQITTTGKQLLKLTNTGLYGRANCTIGGTDPSFTFSIVADHKVGA